MEDEATGGERERRGYRGPLSGEAGQAMYLPCVPDGRKGASGCGVAEAGRRRGPPEGELSGEGRRASSQHVTPHKNAVPHTGQKRRGRGGEGREARRLGSACCSGAADDGPRAPSPSASSSTIETRLTTVHSGAAITANGPTPEMERRLHNNDKPHAQNTNAI